MHAKLRWLVLSWHDAKRDGQLALADDKVRWDVKGKNIKLAEVELQWQHSSGPERWWSVRDSRDSVHQCLRPTWAFPHTTQRCQPPATARAALQSVHLALRSCARGCRCARACIGAAQGVNCSDQSSAHSAVDANVGNSNAILALNTPPRPCKGCVQLCMGPRYIHPLPPLCRS